MRRALQRVCCGSWRIDTPSLRPALYLDRSLLPVCLHWLLLLVFVGLDAFSPPPLVSQLAACGSLARRCARQIAYLGVPPDRLAAIQRFGPGLGAPFSMMLLAWRLASALWALEAAVVPPRRARSWCCP